MVLTYTKDSPMNYRCAGIFTLRLGSNGVESIQRSRKEFQDDANREYSDELGYTESFRDAYIKTMLDKQIVGQMMSGKEFLEGIERGEIKNATGTLMTVYVNGMISNIGFADGGLFQGHFLLSKDMFAKFCDIYEIEVNWLPL